MDRKNNHHKRKIRKGAQQMKKLESFYKSIIDQDRASVVICDTDHKIIYMNQAAVKSYEKYGGADLIGRSIMDCHNPKSQEKMKQVVNWFLEDVYMVALREEGRLIGYYEKHEYRNAETMKQYDLF